MENGTVGALKGYADGRLGLFRPHQQLLVLEQAVQLALRQRQPLALFLPQPLRLGVGPIGIEVDVRTVYPADAAALGLPFAPRVFAGPELAESPPPSDRMV